MLSFREKWHLHACLSWNQLDPYDIVDFVRTVYSTTSSQSNSLRAFRRFATRYYPEIPQSWVRAIRLTRKEFTRQNRKTAARVAQKAETPLNCNVQRYLACMCEFLAAEQQDPAKLAAGLLMATGRRTIEIASCGSFRRPTKVHSDTQPHFWVRFSGPAKRKNAAQARQPYQTSLHAQKTVAAPSSTSYVLPPSAWDIPVLARGDQVLASFQRFRELAGEKSIASRFWQNQVKNVLKAKFPDFIPKNCRAIYSVLTHNLFNPFMALNFWTKMILGHTSVRISHAYLNVRLTQLLPPDEPGAIILPEFRQNICLDPVERQDVNLLMA
jgi:hypothetical protein